MDKKGYVDATFSCIELEHYCDYGTHNEKALRKHEDDGNSCGYSLQIQAWNDSSEPVHFNLNPHYNKASKGISFCMNLKAVDVLIEALTCIRKLKDRDENNG